MAASGTVAGKVQGDPLELLILPESGCPVVSAPFDENTTCSPLYYLCSFVGDHLTGFFCGSISGLSVLLICFLFFGQYHIVFMTVSL